MQYTPKTPADPQGASRRYQRRLAFPTWMRRLAKSTLPVLAIACSGGPAESVAQQPYYPPAMYQPAPAYHGGRHAAGYYTPYAPTWQGAPYAAQPAAYPHPSQKPGHPAGCTCPDCQGPALDAPQSPAPHAEDHDATQAAPVEAPPELEAPPLDSEAIAPDAAELEDASVVDDAFDGGDPGPFASAAGAAGAAGGSSNIVGDFFLGGGQAQYTPPPIMQDVVTFETYSNLRLMPFPTNLGAVNEQFVDPTNPNVVFNVVQPPGVLPGNGSVVSTWDVQGAPGSVAANESGEAVLTGVDTGSGAYVAQVSIPQTTTITINQPTIFIDVPLLTVNRMKIAENNNPIPTDRVFFNYHRYHNALQTPGTIGNRSDLDVNAFTFGLENTFFGGLGSFELRVPFAATIDSTQFADGSGDVEGVEFGNINVNTKMIMWQSASTLVAGGVGVGIPTADDVTLLENQAAAAPLLQIDNSAFRIQPFVAALINPCYTNWALQTWAQWDIALNSNDVASTVNGVTSRGAIRDQTLLYLDAAFTYAMWEGCHCTGVGLTRIAPAVELHYTSTLDEADIFQTPNLLVGNLRGDLDIVNLTLATHFHFGGQGFITPAYVLPLSNGDDRVFDGELAVQAQWNY